MGAGVSMERKTVIVRRHLKDVQEKLEGAGFHVVPVKGTATSWRKLLVTRNGSGVWDQVWFQWLSASNGECCAILRCGTKEVADLIGAKL